MIDFSELTENFQDFLTERKKGVLISCILVLLFCAALLVVAFIPQTQNNSKDVYTAEPYVPDQELLLPQGPSVPQSYAVSREKIEKWDSKDVEKWFTKPDAAAVEKLSAANDNMISEMMGVAP